MKKHRIPWKQVFIIILAFVVGVLFGTGAFSRFAKKEQPAPVSQVPRVQERTLKQETRYADTEALLQWAREPAPLFVVENPVDALPNGLSTKMIPFVVNWRQSSLDSDDEGYYLVHNVNVGSDPVKGVTTMATVKVPVNGIEAVEFVMVRDRVDGKDQLGGHGQLRFIFSKDRRPEIVWPYEKDYPGELYLDDLIISWEAWRPPRVPYDMLEGLNPESYALTVRCISGTQSFLHAALKGNAWESYPLKLPETPDAAEELFRICLMIGDGLSRRLIHQMVEDGDVEKPSEEDLVEWTPEEIERAQNVFSGDRVPDDPIMGLMGQADLSYHLLLRSCLTIAMYAVDLAYERLHEIHNLGPRKRIQVTPDTIPDWVDELADTERGSMLSRLPGIIYWVATHQNVLPSNAYKILWEAGVLQEEDGQPIRYYYSAEGETPYGSLRENM